jgi:hypothetical protein
MHRTRLRQPANRLFLIVQRKPSPRLLRHLVPPGRYLIYRLVRLRDQRQFTGASIARVFFITAATFGAASLYGYTTKGTTQG